MTLMFADELSSLITEATTDLKKGLTVLWNKARRNIAAIVMSSDESSPIPVNGLARARVSSSQVGSTYHNNSVGCDIEGELEIEGEGFFPGEGFGKDAMVHSRLIVMTDITSRRFAKTTGSRF